ncbi:MAG: precorrin-8X methylmutase [Bacillota bacterium]|nr:precorrin-8X methylmutase [Bacillota bacterium]
MSYLNNPMGIENRSFEIIEKELKEIKDYDFDENQMKIVKRIIHTTADFSLADQIVFKGGAVDKSLTTLEKGCKIYVDTKMIAAGVNKKKLRQFGCELVNFVSDEDVAIEAKKRCVTRSTVSMEKACKCDEIRGFVIGNAPTALYKLIELVKENKVKPDFIFGVPVGFVGAKESKELLLDIDVPSISIQGRKGGSTISVAVLNALFYILNNER